MSVFVRLSIAIVLASCAGTLLAAAQQPGQQPVFRAGVDLVSVAVVVRDKQGRVVPSLQIKDFSVTDSGEPRPILDLQADASASIGVAILVDGSGSMPRDAIVVRSIGERLLNQLVPGRDDAALMMFDTRLLVLREFTNDIGKVRGGLGAVDAFGASSIYDAIAGATGHVADGTRKRRALVVVTDGADNASAYTPGEVAWIASTIDVPVYVLAVGVVPDESAVRRPHHGSLFELARATGGDYFAVHSVASQQVAIGRIIEELRHQYLLAFEPTKTPGLRPLEIETRNRSLKVRSRRWYSGEAGD